MQILYFEISKKSAKSTRCAGANFFRADLADRADTKYNYYDFRSRIPLRKN